MFKNKDLKLAIFAFLILITLSIYITFPLIFNLGKLTTGLGDEIVISWIQNWVIHSLTTNPLTFFDANIYFPYSNTLAFSDLFLTSSVLSILPVKIIGEPIVAVNFTLISSLIMLGFFSYLLICYLTKNFLAALLGSMLIVFSPATLDKIVHLQILAIQWVPLSILFYLIFIKQNKTKYLILSLLFFLLQTYNSFLPGYFILFSYLIILIYLWFYKRNIFKKILNKKNLLIVLTSFLFLIPIILPYYNVSREFNYKRDIREAIHLSLQPQDLLYSYQHTKVGHYFTNLLPTNGTYKPGYIGFIFSILTLIVIFYFVRNFKKKDLIFNSFVNIALFGLIMSFGPALHWNGYTIHKPFPIILPYALFYYVVPGFQGFRNSARWEMLFVLMMAISISLFVHKLTKNFSFKKKLLIFLLLFLGIIGEFDFPLKFTKVEQVKDFPRVYSWLSTLPNNVKIIEMPIYNWDIQPYVSAERMRQYYSTIHFKKMINGASGFSPPPWQVLARNLLANFPDDTVLETLKNLKINYILVHKNEYDILSKDKFMVMGKKVKNGNEIISLLLKNKKVKLARMLNNVYIFALNR